MRFFVFTFLSLAPILPGYAVLTKGSIQVKGLNWEKAVPLSTDFFTYDARIIATESSPLLQVQMDLEKARQRETNIEILNGFWADVYPFLGIAGQADRDLTWSPPRNPIAMVINVPETPDAHLQPGVNAFTAVFPSPLTALPLQASAIWRYDPQSGGKLTATFLAPNGTLLPAQMYYGGTRTKMQFSLFGHGLPMDPGYYSAEPVDFFFVPSA
ncbi:hypothetical protein BKA70DRAFT_1560548 [Coprinopsis sp. MPI-PUGE-AT-0042]|nr:hypothetical protein BKA70DRAFT_1560548 [Coprinopsis sp. MPI-PUGE-AT-0042]